MSKEDNTPTVPDPFADDLFAPLAPSNEGGSLEEELRRIDKESQPPVEEPVAPAPVVSAEPQVWQYDDGSSVTIEKGPRGWKATLDSNTGAPPEVFYGSTKDELLVNLSAGKLNATQKIREMNKRIKLSTGSGSEPVVEPAAPAARQPEDRVLTADDMQAIKFKLQEDPSAAFDLWFQKRTGMTASDLVKLAKTGQQANDELVSEAVAKEFIGRHPEYIPYEKNFEALIAWLCKYKLGQPLNDRDPNSMIDVLYKSGKWTAANLDEAYEDLGNDGLLDLQAEEATPAEEVEPAVEPVVEVKPVAPAVPTTTNERIVRETRRPRVGSGNLGIRSRDTIGAVIDDSGKPPSAEELDNLKDEEISALLAGVRKLRMGTRR